MSTPHTITAATAGCSFDCPLCSPNWAHFRLGFNLQKRFFHCWSCGSLRFYDTLKQLLGLPHAQIKELAEGMTSGVLPADEPSVRGKYVEPKGLGPLLPVHLAYLRARGLSDADASMWGLRGFSPLDGAYTQFKWRIFVPFVWRGEAVSFTTRSINPAAKLRYLSASPDQEKYDHKTLLGGEDLVPGHAVCAVEGPFDAFKVGPGAVWLSGTAYKRAQMLRLAKYPVRVVCFDSSDEAQRQARKLVRELEGYDGVTFNVVLDSKDPGEATPRELDQLRRLMR